MSRSAAPKCVHYVRAVYGQDKPKETLEKVLRDVLAHMPHGGDTEIEHPQLGTLATRFRNTNAQDGLFLAIGQGVKDEAMATLGLGVTTESDIESPVPPIEGRAFKLSDAFCLIDENDLLICTDGGLRVASAAFYMRSLLQKGNAPVLSQTMDLVARINQDKTKVLASGIKSIKVISSQYKATQIMEGEGKKESVKKGVNDFIGMIRSLFEDSIENDAKRESLINHESEIVVTTEVKVAGGMTGEAILLEAMDKVAKKEIENPDFDGAELIITAAAGSVSSHDVILQRIKSIKRRQGQNGLDHADAWNKLSEYRNELIGLDLWKK